MIPDTQLLQSIDEILHPRSVAIIGVPRGMKTGKLFFVSLLDQGFPGEIYPVSAHADEIDGFKAYPNVTAIPGAVDLAIILVSQNQALSTLKECAAKGVKGAILYTAGFKETGTEEGHIYEKQLVEVARSSGMRLIGPNCVGIYAPRSGLSFFPQLTKEPGPVGLVSHSGSLAQLISYVGPKWGIRFSKAVNLGNECDLTSSDFLLYLAQDAETQLIGAYIEGIKDGARFFDALYTASLKKPVIMWKTGLTSAGAQAAASHTGALACAADVWEGVCNQTGVASVIGFEAWLDALMGFAMLPEHLGERIAVISSAGGLAVSAAEACAYNGLQMAKLSSDTVATLAAIVPQVGTSIRNPVDVSLAASLDIGIYIQSIQSVVDDPAVDALVIVGAWLNPEANKICADAIIEAGKRSGKAILMVKLPGVDVPHISELCDARIPCFDSSERAMRTYACVRRYQQWRSGRQ